jgi:hypothetical protein
MEVTRHGWVLLALLIGAATLFASYVRAHSSISRDEAKYSTLDYLLLWPILLKINARNRSAAARKQVLSSREIIGWSVVLAMLIAAVVFG